MLLDELQRRHHMGDALTGEVLKIAGLESLHHAILDIMGEPLVVAALDRCCERVGSLIDRFGRLQDRLGRLFGAAGDGMKLAMGACSLFAAGHLVAQRGHSFRVRSTAA